MNKNSLRFLFYSLMVLASWVQADVRSASGRINFDAQNDGQSEMSLTSSGLGIGVSNPSSNLHVSGNVLIEQGQLFIGNNSGSSNLELHGSIGILPITISSDLTIAEMGSASYYLLDTSSDNINIDLPYAGNVIGRLVTLKKIAEQNVVNIQGGGNLMDSASNLILEAGGRASIQFISDGSQWHIVHKSDQYIGSNHLMAHWTLDETSGTLVNDSSGSGYDGLLLGGATFSNNSMSANVNTGLGFDGVNDYVDINDLNIDYSNGYSISFWVNYHTTQQWSRIIDFGRGQSNENILIANPTTTNNLIYQVYHANVSVGSITITAAFTTNALNHFCVTHANDGAVTVFRNGISVGTATIPLPRNINRTSNYIGRSNWATDAYFDGVLDDLRIYDKALTVFEVNDLFQLGQ